MSYSEVTGRLETEGFNKVFLSIFQEADHWAQKVEELEKQLRSATDSRGLAAGNLEHLVLAASRRDEFKNRVQRDGQNLILRMVYKDELYVVEIIPQGDGKSLRRWNKYPVSVIEDKE